MYVQLSISDLIVYVLRHPATLSFGRSHCAVIPIPRVIHMSGMKRRSQTGSTDNATVIAVLGRGPRL